MDVEHVGGMSLNCCCCFFFIICIKVKEGRIVIGEFLSLFSIKQKYDQKMLNRIGRYSLGLNNNDVNIGLS